MIVNMHDKWALFVELDRLREEFKPVETDYVLKRDRILEIEAALIRIRDDDFEKERQETLRKNRQGPPTATGNQ